MTTDSSWLGRFKSQALLDEAALLACMAHIDLNLVRAKLVLTPEHSKYTSVHKRIHAGLQEQAQPVELLPFVGDYRQDLPKGLDFFLEDYLELLDWTGRAWLDLSRAFENLFHSLVRRPDRVEAVVEAQSQRWVQGIGNCRRYFSPG